MSTAAPPSPPTVLVSAPPRPDAVSTAAPPSPPTVLVSAPPRPDAVSTAAPPSPPTVLVSARRGRTPCRPPPRPARRPCSSAPPRPDAVSTAAPPSPPTVLVSAPPGRTPCRPPPRPARRPCSSAPAEPGRRVDRRLPSSRPGPRRSWWRHRRGRRPSRRRSAQVVPEGASQRAGTAGGRCTGDGRRDGRVPGLPLEVEHRARATTGRAGSDVSGVRRTGCPGRHRLLLIRLFHVLHTGDSTSTSPPRSSYGESQLSTQTSSPLRAAVRQGVALRRSTRWNRDDQRDRGGPVDGRDR